MYVWMNVTLLESAELLLSRFSVFLPTVFSFLPRASLDSPIGTVLV